jgi:hypothetical protein
MMNIQECVAPLEYEHRQVYDPPPAGILVTEHHGEVKVCPDWGALTVAAFPERITQPYLPIRFL